jgi:hypothetical protein
VTTDKSDNIFTSYYCSSAVADKPISIDFCCPHLIQGYDTIIEEDGYQYDSFELREADLSGYGRHGTITSTPTFTAGSPRHEGAYLMGNSQISVASLPTDGI